MDQIRIGATVGKAVAIGVWGGLATQFRAPEDREVTAFKQAAITFARTLFEGLTIQQTQASLPPQSARQSYEAHVRQHDRLPEVITLADGTVAVWLGNRHAEKTILYFPGGGYCIPALSGHFSLLEAIAEHLKNDGQEIGVLVLLYDLAPAAPYPRQLQQAVEVLRYAVQSLDKRPSNIVIQGDSSGAHLVLSLLSHLAHPHPSVSALQLGESIAGALLLSPWIDFRTDSESFRRNKHKDVLSSKPLIQWSQAFIDGAGPDPYIHPTLAEPGWWRQLPVEKIFIAAGENEVLLDSIVEMAQRIMEEHPDVTLSRVPGEFHVEPITDFDWKYPPGEQFQAMVRWLGETIAQN
ncbi:hypothetical protein N8T08_004567 [Aspergillus melleus]|uniref:Uncharacterized protein n=1 Tax=Aspergillus melleus TaxID=138277 RepID=A0ACC3B5B8_9EURO|nr:hypothetical protein N8T08_004567 [Aspergillus melleus]